MQTHRLSNKRNLDQDKLGRVQQWNYLWTIRRKIMSLKRKKERETRQKREHLFNFPVLSLKTEKQVFRCGQTVKRIVL